MSKYCGYCGAENTDDAKFCSNCSKPFNDEKKKSNNRKYIIFGIGIVAIVAVAFVAFNLLFGQQKSILQADDGGFLASENSLEYLYDDSATIFGSSYERASIITITFLDKDTLDEIPDDAWDVSQKQNGSVVAWVERANDFSNALYIAGKGGVYANEDSRYLFAGYCSLSEIYFNDCFYTDKVSDMSYMFFGTQTPDDFDLAFFNTSKVTNMQGMFSDSYISELDLSGLDTSNVTDMSYMFYNSDLTDLNLNGFDTSNVTNMCSMFYHCINLENLDISTFDTSNVTDMSYMLSYCFELDNLNTNILDTSQADTTNMYCGTSYETSDTDSDCDELIDEIINAFIDFEPYTLIHISSYGYSFLDFDINEYYEYGVETFNELFENNIGSRYFVNYEITKQYNINSGTLAEIFNLGTSSSFYSYATLNYKSIVTATVTASAKNDSSSYETTFTMYLVNENGTWKLLLLENYDF